MKSIFKFKFFMLLAVLAVAFAPGIDAQVIQPVAHYFTSLSTEHVATATLSFASVPLLATYVKDNCSIPVGTLAELTNKYGKIKIMTVVVEPPVYDADGALIEKGEFYDFAVKRPDISTVRMLLNYAKQGKTDDYVKAFINNLVVGGDVEKIKPEGTDGGDGIVYLGFMTKVDEFLKPYESFLANA